MTYVTQLRAKHAAEKARLAQFQKEQKEARIVDVRRSVNQMKAEKARLTAEHKGQLGLTKKYSQGKNAQEKAQLDLEHKRQMASIASQKITWTKADKIEKEIMADRHKNEMAYAVKMAKKK